MAYRPAMSITCSQLLFWLSWLVICSWSAPTDTPSAASFYVPSIPGIHQDSDHPLTIFAGHILSDPEAAQAADTDITSHLYFVLVKNRRHADRERIMFWFNGGPGCSSFDGLMMEVGPWRMNGQGSFQVAEGGWEEYTTMVYVDQPAGTGFSYTSSDHYIHTLEEASSQFIVFLRNFYRIFPEYKQMDTYLGGESYAGQYIPYFANAILESNDLIPLKGVAIGNGWIDARSHYPSYIDFATKMGILVENSDDWKEAKEKTDACMQELDQYGETLEPISIPKCDALLHIVSKPRARLVDGKDMCLNIYDVRLDDTSPDCGMNWPPDIGPITKYLGRSDVVNAFHASEHAQSWVECRPRVHRELHENQSNSSITVLPRVLERIPVLLFAGDQDLICNHIGQESMISMLEWGGEVGLGKVQTLDWTVNGVQAGTWLEGRNLTYAKIFNASHMAPFDVPHVAHDMILRFMGVNFTALVDGTGRIPSSVGEAAKPSFLSSDDAASGPDGEQTNGQTGSSGKSPEQDKAMWEAYYNAGSAALVLVLVFILIAAVMWCRRRRVRSESAGNVRLPVDNRSSANGFGASEERVGLARRGSRKGKERAIDGDSGDEEENRPIFDVGNESDGDEESIREKSQERYRDRDRP